ncbi:MAG TPA: DNA repair protein RecO [Candidatus Alectryocaccobium stercorigallinarum]|nr:DNA repair protein RecO [Candidatus Alectryocaccobium stercorigallinarum]
MSDIIKVNGTVLSASPIGEQDKRVVLETCELGRITVFARGCRRSGSPLQAAANPFVTGQFSVISGSSAYRMADASIIEYFREIAALQPGVYMGFYFLDLVDYYGREGIDGTDMLNLLFVSLKALLNEKLPDRLVRRIFEMKLLALNGEYFPEPDKMPERIYPVCRYITDSPAGKVYSFNVDEDILSGLENVCDKALKRTIDKELKSKKIMEMFYK